MNILQVPPYAPPMEGGSERYCFNLSKRLLTLGHEVEVYTSRIPMDRPTSEIREGILVTRFFCHSYLLNANPLSFFWRVLMQNLHRFDLVHVHSYIYFLANQVAYVRTRKKFPFILHLHGGLDYIHPNRLGLKVTAMKIVYDRTLGPFTMKMADKIIPCCETDAKTAIKRFGADPSKIEVIPNSINVDMFRESNHPNPVNIIYIGRLSGLKGGYQLPRIVEDLYNKFGDEIEFTIVGEGQLEHWMREKLSNYPVTFTGRIPNEYIPDILETGGLFILPSFLEGFPLVNLEALASSIPVVCYNVGGCWELIKNWETGFLVPVGNLDLFIKRISYLIENDSERKKMGRKGRELVKKNYDWEKNTYKIIDIYRSLI